MLPAANRMRRSTDFSSVVRDGVRARGGRLVVHHRAARAGPDRRRRVVGLVVSKNVGNSVSVTG